jgi:hypothetical protein
MVYESNIENKPKGTITRFFGKASQAPDIPHLKDNEKKRKIPTSFNTINNYNDNDKY